MTLRYRDLRSCLSEMLRCGFQAGEKARRIRSDRPISKPRELQAPATNRFTSIPSAFSGETMTKGEQARVTAWRLKASGLSDAPGAAFHLAPTS